MSIKKSSVNDVQAIMKLVHQAQLYFKNNGIDQWQDGYPDQEIIFEDILESRGYVAVENQEVVAYAALYKGNEAAYNDIYDGKREHDNYLYISFHRIAVAKEAAGRGVAQTFLQGLIEGEKGPDFRCDTHPDNKVMQHLLEKLGFHYCGKVPIDGVRLAYQKIKRKAETSLFQVISEDDRWDYRAEQSQND